MLPADPAWIEEVETPFEQQRAALPELTALPAPSMLSVASRRVALYITCCGKLAQPFPRRAAVRIFP